MHIGSVAKRTGLTPDAIRLYERNALLPRAQRTQGGFRQFSEEKSKLWLSQKTPYLAQFESQALYAANGAPVRRRLQAKLVDVQQKLDHLRRLERELRLALRGCERELHKRS